MKIYYNWTVFYVRINLVSCILDDLIFGILVSGIRYKSNSWHLQSPWNRFKPVLLLILFPMCQISNFYLTLTSSPLIVNEKRLKSFKAILLSKVISPFSILRSKERNLQSFFFFFLVWKFANFFEWKQNSSLRRQCCSQFSKVLAYHTNPLQWIFLSKFKSTVLHYLIQ